MEDLADLYPGFASRYVATKAGRLFARIGGRRAPLLLAHGFPQTGAIWHRIAPALAERFTVVIPDLRGYGWSAAPESQGGAGYTKRVMGSDLVALMEELGHARFAFAGHDRGARIGYRLALDHPGRLTQLALLDIIPTFAVWAAMEAGEDAAPHWRFLAEPEPGPERKIAEHPQAYYEDLLRNWSKAKSLDVFDPRALAHYRAGWGDPSRIHASCEDYRAGAGQDRQADEADLAAARTIDCSTHLLASSDYLSKHGREEPLAVWRRSFAPEATGVTIDSGHFLAEENPEATGAALQAFLAG
ncbi:alpha/beta fold hydrolase [Lichenifustis flavocetrariae]|uniref:Alpha/beta hydrolase n=1 Tax=Lichenifustis flavocetrariae TaxID=2949735 RepID=A0AA41YZT6_9HYPH|nr:alpha/beta hydrolase [Lichenifustis flavocetrariae]MCW6510331.1 alpha/beta hydrolase [Lichenifustis flavocetrariae]